MMLEETAHSCRQDLRMVKPAVNESIRIGLMRLPAANIDTSCSYSNCHYAINRLTFVT